MLDIEFDVYCKDFSDAATLMGYGKDEVKAMLGYARRLNKQGLPIIYDQNHLGKLVGYDYVLLLTISNCQRSFYKHYEIPKRSGGMRAIEEPLPSLKEIQTWILKNILEPAAKKHVSPVAKAFVPGKNLRENARFHKNREKVMALDIHDFFGSIKFGEVYGVFEKLGYREDVCVMLTNLCIYRGCLPQGAPTSPMLSNLIFTDVDKKIFHYCRSRNILYTRYADDMTFSGDNLSPRRIIAYVRVVIWSKRLRLNDEKTKVMGKGMAQTVTGVVVNEKLQVPRQYRDKVRQEVYYCIKYGFKGHMENQREAGKLPSWIHTVEVYKHHLEGKINYVLQINPKDQEFVRYRNWLKEIGR